MKEKDILSLIRKTFSYSSSDIILGAGDDCAVVDVGDKDFYLVMSVDDMVDGTHFISSFLQPQEIASRLVRINLSDIYSMGDSYATWCVTSAGLNKNLSDKWIERFIKALKDEFDLHGVKNVGGNLVKSSTLFFSITVFGKVKKNGIVTRKGAKEGDLLCICGGTGFSSVSVELMKKKDRKKLTSVEKKLIYLFSNPPLYHHISRKVSSFASSMIDNSDGIIKTAQILSAENNLKVVMDKKALIKTASEYVLKYESDEDRIMDHILKSDDYNLIFSIHPSDLNKVDMDDVTVIGRFESGKGVIISGYEIKTKTFEHF